MVRQMQNTVSVHIKGKGHRTPGTVWPWYGISDHRLSSSVGLRLLVPRQTGGATSRAQHPGAALSRAAGARGVGVATVPPAGDTGNVAPGCEILGDEQTSARSDTDAE